MRMPPRFPPFQWVSDPSVAQEPAQVILLEMNPAVIKPAVSVQPNWNGTAGIRRGIQDGKTDLLLEDHLTEHLDEAGELRPVDAAIVGAAEIHQQFWTMEDHLNAFRRRHPDRRMVARLGNGNLLCNPFYVGFDGHELFCLRSEPAHFRHRHYACLTCWKTGLDKGVTIEELRISPGPGAARFSLADGTDVTDGIECATSGLPLVRNGEPIGPEALARFAREQQYYDLRHLFRFGRIPVGAARWLDAGLAAFWDGHGNQRTEAVLAALRGEPVSVEVSQFGRAAVAEALRAKGYVEEPALSQPGHFQVTGTTLRLVLLPGIYPHHGFGVRPDGTMISVANS